MNVIIHRIMKCCYWENLAEIVRTSFDFVFVEIKSVFDFKGQDFQELREKFSDVADKIEEWANI